MMYTKIDAYEQRNFRLVNYAPTAVGNCTWKGILTELRVKCIIMLTVSHSLISIQMTHWSTEVLENKNVPKRAGQSSKPAINGPCNPYLCQFAYNDWPTSDGMLPATSKYMLRTTRPSTDTLKRTYNFFIKIKTPFKYHASNSIHIKIQYLIHKKSVLLRIALPYATTLTPPQ